jgi:L-iditol 2-dehydrogenase
MKMLAGVLYGPSDVRMEEREVPEPKTGELLVRIGAATTCGTDAKVFLRGGHPKMIRPPDVFGHEFAGVVHKLGGGVSAFKPGQRVVVANSAPCNHCFYCKTGRQSMCEDLLFINGAYAQYVVIPERIVLQNLLPVPDHLPYAHAALVEPLACAVHGIAESNIKLGDTVVVNGAGPIGLFFLQLAKLNGARVITCDLSADRLAVARKLGADETVDASKVEDQVEAVKALTDGRRGVDVAIEAVGHPQVWEKTILMARKGGTVNLFGGCAPGSRITVSTDLIHYSEITLKGVFHHTPHYVRIALDLLARGQINAAAFITATRPLEKLAEALQMIVNHDGIKTAVIPPDAPK